jgi:hypothetical protein
MILKVNRKIKTNKFLGPKIMTRLNILLAFVLLTTTTACVQVTEEYSLKKTQLAVSSVRDLAITYAPESKFALSPKYLKVHAQKTAKVQAVYKKYADEIIANLARNKFHLAQEGDKVDFYVGFGLALSDDLSDTKINEKFGVSPGLNADKDNNKGSFLIYVDDATTNQRVWRGAAQGFVDEEFTQDERQARAEKVVDMLLSQYYDKK